MLSAKLIIIPTLRVPIKCANMKINNYSLIIDT